jgi:hypothetical protein
MLTKADDYPIHQSPEPIAYAGPSRNFYDRYFFNGYHREEDVFFAAAMGIYPQLDIMDAALSLIVDGVQHNLCASRIMRNERMATAVGPIKVTVVEPLQRLRLEVNDAERGIAASLEFTARAPAQEEPRFTRRAGAQIMMDATRMTQHGVWSGLITLRGRRIDVRPDTWWGCRDRSWGIRGVGAPDAQPNPGAARPQFYWLWAPLNFPEGGTLYHLNDDAHGRPWNTNGVYVPCSGEAEQMVSSSARIEYASGTRHARAATIRFERLGGGAAEITLQPRFHWYMKGVGYGHPEFSHGSYHGELATGYDEYRLADVDDATNLHIQAICDTQLSGDFGQHTGRGVLEQLIVGPHGPSGFREMLDMAP